MKLSRLILVAIGSSLALNIMLHVPVLAQDSNKADDQDSSKIIDQPTDQPADESLNPTGNPQAKDCGKNLFFGIPNWSSGLTFKVDQDGDCNIDNFKLSDIWLVVANVARMALALAGLIAVIFIIIGGLRYITSAGNPDNAQAAIKTLTNAALGLIIAISASVIVGLVAGIF